MNRNAISIYFLLSVPLRPDSIFEYMTIMSTDKVEKQTVTADSSDSHHGASGFAEKLEHAPVGNTSDGHGELPGVYENVRANCCALEV